MGDVFKKLFQVFHDSRDVQHVRWDVPVKVLHRAVFLKGVTSIKGLTLTDVAVGK